MSEMATNEMMETIKEMLAVQKSMIDAVNDLPNFMADITKVMDNAESPFKDSHDDMSELYTALAMAQGEMLSADTDARNKFYSSNYATLNSIWAVCRQPLSQNGLAVIQSHSTNDGYLRVDTRLIHSSGQSITLLPVVLDMNGTVDSKGKLITGMSLSQEIAKAATYSKRKALMSLLGIPEDDNDGEPTDGRQSQPKRKQTAPTKQKNNQKGSTKPSEATVWFNSLTPEQQTAAKSDGGGIEVALVEHLGMTPENAASALLSALDGEPVPIAAEGDPNEVKWGKAKRRVELYNKIKAMESTDVSELIMSNPNLGKWLKNDNYTLSELSKMLVTEGFYDDVPTAWKAIGEFDWKGKLGWGQPKDNAVVLKRDQALKFMNSFLS